MKQFETVCPYCEVINTIEIPTYQETLNYYKDVLKENPKEKWVIDEIESLKKEKDLSKLDECYYRNTPIFCKNCDEQYYYNPEEKEYNFVEKLPEMFTTKNIIKRLTTKQYDLDSIVSFIYFLYNKNNGYTKIGYAQNIKKRQQELRVALVETDLILSFEVTVQNASEIEKIFHNIFRKYLVKGEWYKLDVQILAKLKERENLVQSMLVEGRSYNQIRDFIFSL